MKKKFLGICIPFCSMYLLAQANISGTADLSLIDAGMDCNGTVRLVEVHADVGGLSGDGGLAGVNSFVIKINLDDESLFSTAYCPNDPLPFSLVFTEKSLVASQNAVILTGWLADPGAPNGSYHLVTLQFRGAAETVSLTIDEAESGLGSRVTNGFGPGAIAVQAPPETTFGVPDVAGFSLLQALPFWSFDAPFYDLIPNSGHIDVLDLAKMVNCLE